MFPNWRRLLGLTPTAPTLAVLWHLPLATLREYRIELRLDDGARIAGPPLRDVTREGDAVVFRSRRLRLERTSRPVAGRLLTPDGALVREFPLDSPFVGRDGDSVEVSYTLTATRRDTDPHR